jgi:hypothetical protein
VTETREVKYAAYDLGKVILRGSSEKLDHL